MVLITHWDKLRHIGNLEAFLPCLDPKSIFFVFIASDSTFMNLKTALYEFLFCNISIPIDVQVPKHCLGPVHRHPVLNALYLVNASKQDHHLWHGHSSGLVSVVKLKHPAQLFLQNCKFKPDKDFVLLSNQYWQLGLRCTHLRGTVGHAVDGANKLNKAQTSSIVLVKSREY